MGGFYFIKRSVRIAALQNDMIFMLKTIIMSQMTQQMGIYQMAVPLKINSFLLLFCMKYFMLYCVLPDLLIKIDNLLLEFLPALGRKNVNMQSGLTSIKYRHKQPHRLGEATISRTFSNKLHLRLPFDKGCSRN